MTMCGAVLSYELAARPPCSFQCGQPAGHKGVHYCLTVQGGVAWPTPEHILATL